MYEFGQKHQMDPKSTKKRTTIYHFGLSSNKKNLQIFKNLNIFIHLSRTLRKRSKSISLL